MNRRQFISSAAALTGSTLLSGCLFGNNGGPWYDLSFENLGPEFGTAISIGHSEQTQFEQTVLQSAVKGEEGQSAGWYPFRRDFRTHAVIDGNYYEVTTKQTGETTHNRLTLHGRVASDSEYEGKPPSITNFPKGDQTPLRYAVTMRRAKSSEGSNRRERRYVFRTTHPEDSWIIPEPKYEFITHDDEIIKLTVENRDVTEDVYTTTASKVAETSNAFERYAVTELLNGDLSNPSLLPEQDTLVEQALNDEYHSYGEEDDLSEPFRQLLQRCGYEVEPDSYQLVEQGRKFIFYDERYYVTSVSVTVA